jgi:HEAT repeat protein
MLLGLACLLLNLNGAAAQQPPKKEDMPKFLENLTSKDAKVRLTAVDNIAELGEIKAAYTKDAIAPLVDLVQNDEDAKVREAAATALSRIDADAARAVPALIDRLKNEKDERALQASVASIGYFGPAAKEALPLLKEFRDKTGAELAKVREEATKANKEGDTEKFREIIRKSGPIRQMNQAAAQSVRSIEAKQ